MITVTTKRLTLDTRTRHVRTTPSNNARLGGAIGSPIFGIRQSAVSDDLTDSDHLHGIR